MNLHTYYSAVFTIKDKISYLHYWLILAWLSVPVMTFSLDLVYDPTAVSKLVQEFKLLQKEYDLLNQTFKNAQKQLHQVTQLTKDAEGNYGYGEFLNSIPDLKNREWSPNNWDDALKDIAGENPERYHLLVEAYRKIYPESSSDEMEHGLSKVQTELYIKSSNVNRAAMVQATYAFNEIKQHLENIHKLSNNIDSTQNTKAAIDLNNRLLTEIAYLGVEELKMQTLINEQIAQTNAASLQGEIETARTNTLNQ